MTDPTAAIFGVRLSLVTAMVAAAGAGIASEPLEAAWGGVKLVNIVFGAVGAGVTLSIVQDWGWGKVLMTLICGLALAALGTPFLLHYLPPPEKLSLIGESAYAAAAGAVGVYLIPGLHAAAKAFGSNPFAVVDWVRGRGGPPTPPAGGAP
jgi:hypothetical protein